MGILKFIVLGLLFLSILKFFNDKVYFKKPSPQECMFDDLFTS